MSERNNTVTFSLLEKLKKDKDKPVIPEEALTLMNEILHENDLAGFLRVIEVLRTIGDEVEIKADILDLSIKCSQCPTEILELEEGAIQKKTEAVQQVTIDFAYLPILLSESESDDPEPEHLSFDDYLEGVTSILNKAIIALMYWHDGVEKKNSNTESVE